MSLSRSLLSVLSALALAALLVPAAPAPRVERPAVELVLCLDTTASMAGMLEGVRRSYWSMCNTILAAKPAPSLRVGVVAYRDRGEEYVTRVFDLTDDLDAAYVEIAGLEAAGGGDTPEHVNQALHDAVHMIRWSADRSTIRIAYLIGDAAPHTDYENDVKYPTTCREAAKLGLVVNAIRCGDDGDCGEHFARIARLGGGEFATVALDGGVRTVPTPLDKRLAAINALVTKGAALPDEAAADRAGCMCRSGREGFDAGAELLREARELGAKRATYLDDHRKRERGEAPGLDAQVLAMLRRQAGRRLRF